MSGSETGTAMVSRGEEQPYSLPSQSQIQNMRLAFGTDGTPVYKHTAPHPSPAPANGGSAGGGGGGDGSAPASGGMVGSGGGGGIVGVPPGINMNLGVDSMKKKRGRPRKYGPDGSMALAMVPGAHATVTSPTGGFSPLSGGGGGGGGGGGSSNVGGGSSGGVGGGGGGVGVGVGVGVAASGGPMSTNSTNAVKKSRGRPPGSVNKKQHFKALDGAGSLGIGVGFTPHIITVKAGEDVSSKIMSFSQNGPRAVCILSANGAISNVTLRQPATSGGTVTYEGRFEILSLSGSFLLSENNGQRSRTGGLSVSLSGPDGRVLGGGVAGLLTAASPVQVIVGSFIADGRKEPKPPTNHVEPFWAPPKLNSGDGMMGAGSPPSHGTFSESSDGPASPLNQSAEPYSNTNTQAMSGMPWK